MENKLSKTKLTELYHGFDCSTWKSKISELILSKDNIGLDEIIIPDDYIKLLLKDGTKEQLALVTSKDYGINIPEEDKGIIDKVKTFEDALAIVGTSEDERWLLGYSGEDISILSSIAFLKLSIIAKALRNGVVLDWTNSSQYKYLPYFTFGSGSGWVCGGYDCWSAGSDIGSRLYVDTNEKAIYMGKQFISLYNDMFKAS